MNHFTSVLSARVGASQGAALVRADSIGDRVDRSILKVWKQVLQLVDLNPWDLQQRLEHLLYLIAGTAIHELGAGLNLQAREVSKEVSKVVFNALPPGHRNLLAEIHGKTFTEARKPTQRQLDEMREMIFPPQTQAQADQIVYKPTAGVSWQARIAQQTRLADPGRIAQAVSSWRASGKAPGELLREISPMVQGVRSSARRVARTEGQRVAMQTRMESYERLGDLVIGYQIHATMDSHTRPHHAARNGQTYFKNPKPGQLSVSEMPIPPQESDGSVAHNCRCWLTPIVDVQPQVEKDPDARAVFQDAEKNLIPDPASYHDWFGGAPLAEKVATVGLARLAAAAARAETVTQAVPWTAMLKMDGNLLTTKEIRNEGPRVRAKRIARVNAMIQQRRLLAKRIAQYGYLPPRYQGAVAMLGNRATVG